MKKTYDAIVIGAGVLGAAVSASLAGAGYSVLILERGEVAQGASGGNLGQISIVDRWEPWHMKLAKNSLAYYENDLSKEFDIGYVRSGGSVVLTGEIQKQAAKEAMEHLHTQSVDCNLYTGKEMALAEPNLFLGAAEALLFCPLEGKIDPLATTLALINRAKTAGTVLLSNTPVIGFCMHNRRIVSVKTPVGAFSAGWVINCAGPRAAFIAEMAGVQIPICFHKGTAFVSQPFPPTIRGPIVEGSALFRNSPNPPKRQVGFGTIQTAANTILIAQSTEICETDDKSVNMPSLALVAKRFLTYFPQLEDLQIVRAWAAVTTYTEDGLPVFGFSRNADNFFTVAGFKGAFTTAPAVGELALHTLQGTMDPNYLSCSPDRMLAF